MEIQNFLGREERGKVSKIFPDSSRATRMPAFYCRGTRMRIRQCAGFAGLTKRNDRCSLGAFSVSRFRLTYSAMGISW